MLTYFISDLHLDAWCPLTTNKGILRKSFEEIYNRYFIPAEAVSIAGDVADDDVTFVAFCEFIAEKYKQVYMVFGNHDLTVRGSFGQIDGYMQWKTTEDKLDYLKIALQLKILMILWIQQPQRKGYRKFSEKRLLPGPVFPYGQT